MLKVSDNELNLKWQKWVSYKHFVFQNNQADLENATEVLSGYLERDISQDSLQDIKQKVQDKYRWESFPEVKMHKIMELVFVLC